MSNPPAFLIAKPYLPQGSLLTALAYPNEEKVFNRDEMIEVLKQVSLGHLQDRLDQEQDWTRILSLGEQQRLAFCSFTITQTESSIPGRSHSEYG